MKTIEVACAIIEKDGLILAAQRSETMSLPLKWEFPGGKLEPGEDAGACLHRELREELGVDIRIHRRLQPADWQYPDFAVRLHPFVCTLAGFELHAHEHKAIRWVSPQELPTLDWAEADFPVIREYLGGRENGEGFEKVISDR